MATTETSGNGRAEFNAANVGNSPFFAREDIGDGLIGRISGMSYENVAPPDQPEDEKWCASFSDHIKKLVINKTRARQISAIAGGGSEQDWIDTRIEMFDDPAVEFKGKEVGGIRVRPPKVESDAELNDDIPF